MLSLVIHAPQYQVVRVGKKSFCDTFFTGIGEGYAINNNLHQQIRVGCKVILLCKDKKYRAEGKLIRLKPAMKNGKPFVTNNGIQRYDVFAKNFKKVPYQSEPLNKNGVALVGPNTTATF